MGKMNGGPNYNLTGLQNLKSFLMQFFAYVWYGLQKILRRPKVGHSGKKFKSEEKMIFMN